jgi:hypothetical protein
MPRGLQDRPLGKSSSKDALHTLGGAPGAPSVIPITVGYRLHGERSFPSPALRGHSWSLGQVQQFVQESCGAIELKSEVGVGTAARTIPLPVSRPLDGNGVESVQFNCIILSLSKSF